MNTINTCWNFKTTKTLLYCVECRNIWTFNNATWNVISRSFYCYIAFVSFTNIIVFLAIITLTIILWQVHTHISVYLLHYILIITDAQSFGLRTTVGNICLRCFPNFVLQMWVVVCDQKQQLRHNALVYIVNNDIDIYYITRTD